MHIHIVITRMGADSTVKTVSIDVYEYDISQIKANHEKIIAMQDAEISRLQKIIDMLKRQIYGASSEKRSPGTQQEFVNIPEWDALMREADALNAATAREETPVKDVAKKSPAASAERRSACGPRPLPPGLPREVVNIPDPDISELIDPLTGRIMKPAYTESVESLARKPASYYVIRYVRNVFTNEAKSAPVYSPWPAQVLTRAHMDMSVVAHIATLHYADHMPFYRIQKQLERAGINLSRSTQVSLMSQLDEKVEPLVNALRTGILEGGYIHLDATPIDMLDPNRPGAVREATLWAYRSRAGPVFFDFKLNKSPDHPSQLLDSKHYRGFLQTDAAQGLNTIGDGKAGIVHLACWAHARRKFHDAFMAKEQGAAAFLDIFRRIYRVDALARQFHLDNDRRHLLRQRHSLPAARSLFDLALSIKAAVLAKSLLPKSFMAQAANYLCSNQTLLLRCFEFPIANLDNNPVENAIRPLKLGAKNWLFIGHPSAGDRLANLFTLVENCRQEGIDPEAYLIDVIGLMDTHPQSRIAEILPAGWKLSRSAKTVSPPQT